MPLGCVLRLKARDVAAEVEHGQHRQRRSPPGQASGRANRRHSPAAPPKAACWAPSERGTKSRRPPAWPGAVSRCPASLRKGGARSASARATVRPRCRRRGEDRLALATLGAAVCRAVSRGWSGASGGLGAAASRGLVGVRRRGQRRLRRSLAGGARRFAFGRRWSSWRPGAGSGRVNINVARRLPDPCRRARQALGSARAAYPAGGMVGRSSSGSTSIGGSDRSGLGRGHARRRRCRRVPAPATALLGISHLLPDHRFLRRGVRVRFGNTCRQHDF